MEAARQNAGELILVATGPLTNVALACKLDPDFVSNGVQLTSPYVLYVVINASVLTAPGFRTLTTQYPACSSCAVRDGRRRAERQLIRRGGVQLPLRS